MSMHTTGITVDGYNWSSRYKQVSTVVQQAYFTLNNKRNIINYYCFVVVIFIFFVFFVCVYVFYSALGPWQWQVINNLTLQRTETVF